MSQVRVGEETKQISREQLVELDELAAKKKISREAAAELMFKPAPKKGRARKGK